MTVFSRIQKAAAEAKRRGDHSEVGRLSRIEMILGDLRAHIDSAEKPTIPDALAALGVLRSAIFGDANGNNFPVGLTGDPK